LRQSLPHPAPVPGARGNTAARLRLFLLSFSQHAHPHGFVEIWAEDWLLVEPYRFGSGTAEFLICRRCGVYIGAVGETAAGTRAVINTNCLDDRAAFTQQPTPVDHDSEATEDRLARRATHWTPAALHR
jgi:hypothetical protein